MQFAVTDKNKSCLLLLYIERNVTFIFLLLLRNPHSGNTVDHDQEF